MSPFCCHLRTHLPLGYIRSVCTLTAHECRNISFFLCSETVLRDFLRKKNTNFKHLSKRDVNYNHFRDLYSLHLDTLMPYDVIHVGTPFTRAMVILHLKSFETMGPTIDLPVVLDLCPLFSSTSVFLKKVRQHWKKKQKPKAIVRKESYNSSLPHNMPTKYDVWDFFS